jgi:hypothetical protein
MLALIICPPFPMPGEGEHLRPRTPDARAGAYIGGPPLRRRVVYAGSVGAAATLDSGLWTLD